MAEKKKRLLTPVGFAKWAHLHAPKEPFKDKNGRVQGDPKYMIDVCFSPDDPAWKLWAGELKAAIKALPVQMDKVTKQPIPKQIPIKPEIGGDDQPTGRYFVTFKTGEQFKPGVFDRYGNVMENPKLGNESKIRVAYVTTEYDAFGGGIALYLNAVQVLELVEFQSQSATAYGFDVEPAPAVTAGGPPLAEEDDLPF
jgi:hypothetical protein